MVDTLVVYKIKYDGGESEVSVSPYHELLLRRSWGRVLDVPELIYVFGTSEELRNFFLPAQMPVRYYTVRKHIRTSGAVDYALLPLGNYKEARFHVSMYKKVNQGIKVPFDSFGTVLKVLQEDYESSIPLFFEYSIEKAIVPAYSNIYLGLPASYLLFGSHLYEDEL